MKSSVVAKGQFCIETARTAYDLIYTKSDAKEAEKQLSLLQDSGKYLQQIAEERSQNMAETERRLKKENSELESQKQCYDSTISRLTNDKYSAQCRLNSQRRALEENKNELHKAESQWIDAHDELDQAREKEHIVQTVSVVGGIALGLVTFGIGGFVAGAAVGAGVGALINELEGKEGRAQRAVQRKKTDIERVQAEISVTETALSNLRSEINAHARRLADNQTRLQKVHDEVTRVLKAIAFQKRAVEFWQLFTQACGNATERTQRLKTIVARAAEKENVRVLRSDGVITIAETFVDAWEEISVKQGQIM